MFFNFFYFYLNVSYSYGLDIARSVSLSVCRDRESYKSDWTDRHAIWDVDSDGPKKWYWWGCTHWRHLANTIDRSATWRWITLNTYLNCGWILHHWDTDMSYVLSPCSLLQMCLCQSVQINSGICMLILYFIRVYMFLPSCIQVDPKACTYKMHCRCTVYLCILCS